MKFLGDIFALLSLFFLILLIVCTVVTYQHGIFAKSEIFLKGTNATDINFGNSTYPENYYEKGYPKQ